MSRPTPRRSSSRAATPRPRKIAGGRTPADTPSGPVDEPTVEPGTEEPVLEEPEGQPAEDEADDGAAEHGPDEPWPNEDEDGSESSGGGSALRSPKVTRFLLILVAVLAVVLVLQSLWWLRHSLRDEPEPPKDSEGAIAVPEDRPVLPTELAWQEGVEAAAKAAEKIVTRSYQNYDKEVDEATALMTDEFAEEYRTTTDDVREEFVGQQTTVEVRVVGQGAVRANDTQLQALVFLNHYVIHERGKDAGTTYTPYRALLTMVNTEDGWLVDDLETK
jgi:Mce-associated membrane protein